MMVTTQGQETLVTSTEWFLPLTPAPEKPKRIKQNDKGKEKEALITNKNHRVFTALLPKAALTFGVCKSFGLILSAIFIEKINDSSCCSKTFSTLSESCYLFFSYFL